MSDRREIECWLTDMDGVLVHENHPVPGASELLQQWRDEGKPYLVLTNNSIFTPRDLSARLRASGLHVPEESIWTSALATADFLQSQIPGGSAFVIGEAGITNALHEVGFIMTETDPDYVVVGETRNYSFEAITKAIRFIGAGARFIATNPDATGPSVDGVLPATGAISRHPEATVEDSYAIQGVWRDKNLAAGRRLVGRKIGLTSKAMQQATGITEPDYGVMFEDTVYRSGADIPVDLFSNVRIEVELAFVLKEPLEGPDCTLDDALRAIDYAVPALEVLNSHIELEGRTIVDTISDNAAYGAMVLGETRKRPDEIDLRWVPGVLSRNGEIEETGVAAGVLGHPATGVAWLANKLHQHGARLEAGEIILAGSFTRPLWVSRGD